MLTRKTSLVWIFSKYIQSFRCQSWLQISNRFFEFRVPQNRYFLCNLKFEFLGWLYFIFTIEYEKSKKVLTIKNLKKFKNEKIYQYPLSKIYYPLILSFLTKWTIVWKQLKLKSHFSEAEQSKQDTTLSVSKLFTQCEHSSLCYCL